MAVIGPVARSLPSAHGSLIMRSIGIVLIAFVGIMCGTSTIAQTLWTCSVLGNKEPMSSAYIERYRVSGSELIDEDDILAAFAKTEKQKFNIILNSEIGLIAVMTNAVLDNKPMQNKMAEVSVDVILIDKKTGVMFHGISTAEEGSSTSLNEHGNCMPSSP